MPSQPSSPSSEPYDESAGQAALERDRRGRDRAAHLSSVLAEQEAAARTGPGEMDSDERTARAAWERDTLVFGEAFGAERDALVARWLPDDLDLRGEVVAEEGGRVHVYGPDDGTGGNRSYRNTWINVSGRSVGTAGIGAHADILTGTFDASHYTINNWQTAEAGLGCATFRPQRLATMRIRPFVSWNGYDTLRHRVFQPGTTERRRAICVAEIGIMVQRRAALGTHVTTLGPHWAPPLWRHAADNPPGVTEYHEDTAIPSTGLEFEVVGNQRSVFWFWVLCKVGVFAEQGFAVSTYAGATLSCNMPFLVVEEVPMGQAPS